MCWLEADGPAVPVSPPAKEEPMLKIKKGFKQMVAEAEAEVETLSVDEAIKLHGKDDVTFIDLRDPREQWREGGVPGAVSVTRGMLEFWIDPESPYYKDLFAAENKKFVFFCAGGWRSALAAKTAQDMGLSPVAHVKGGFGEWKKAGGPTVAIEQKPPAEKK
jgi:rhodanese-related sulfurtransferase